MSTTPPLPPALARWDSQDTTWDSGAVVAAPVVVQAHEADRVAYGSVRNALLWRGTLKPAPPPAADSINQWPAPTPKETPAP